MGVNGWGIAVLGCAWFEIYTEIIFRKNGLMGLLFFSEKPERKKEETLRLRWL